MGEYADMAIESILDEMATGDLDFVQAINNPIKCKYCKKGGLHWEWCGYWHPHTKSGKPHMCSKMPRSQTPRDTKLIKTGPSTYARSYPLLD